LTKIATFSENALFECFHALIIEQAEVAPKTTLTKYSPRVNPTV
jgi:hypothetical protein